GLVGGPSHGRRLQEPRHPAVRWSGPRALSPVAGGTPFVGLRAGDSEPRPRARMGAPTLAMGRQGRLSRTGAGPGRPRKRDAGDSRPAVALLAGGARAAQ